MRVAFQGREARLGDLAAPLPLDSMVARAGAWEVEIGFGKGRYLIDRAERESGRSFVGIEVASAYYRRVRDRVFARHLDNVVLLRGEAVYLLSAVLPSSFADVVHVYFPDPWPKARHRSRRLFHPETIDLVLGLMRPGGRLDFATDFEVYGEAVEGILASHPALRLRRLEGPWPDGPRTNYERKYARERRPIIRLEAVRTDSSAGPLLHPGGRKGVLSALAVAGD